MGWELQGLASTTIDRDTGAILFTFGGNDRGAAIANFAPQAPYVETQIEMGLAPASVPIAYTPPAPVTGLVTLQTDLAEVYSIAQNGDFYLMSLKADPFPGEFTFDRGSGTLVVNPLPGRLDPALDFVVEGAETVGIPTNYVPPTLFQQFWGLPLRGTVSWDIPAEGHPSSSLELECGVVELPVIRDRFRIGRKLSWAGVGFAVQGYTEQMVNTDNAPGLWFKVKIALGGWWESAEHQELSLLLGPRSAILTGAAVPAQCNPANNPAGTSTGRSRYTTVADLAKQVGVPFVGHSAPLLHSTNTGVITNPGDGSFVTLKMSDKSSLAVQANGPWAVSIPSDTTAETTASWDSEMQSRLRINGAFADYSDPKAVYARDLWSARTWTYRVLETNITIQGDARFSPTHYGYAKQLKATRLSGQFSETSNSTTEDTQGNQQSPPIPRWIPKPLPIYEMPSGDEYWFTPPKYIKSTATMSLNADASGPTKEYIQSFIQGGIEIRRVREVWGFAYTSRDITDNNGKVANTSLASNWRMVDREVTEPKIDATTGYITGSRTIGQKLQRYKPESDEFELRNLPGGSPAQRIYQHHWVPSLKAEGKLLRPYGSYYKDSAAEIPPHEVIEICQADGTLAKKVVLDPNYTPPLFEAASRAYTNAFSWIPDPEDVAQAGKLLMTGQEMDAFQTAQILPSAKTIGSSGTNSNEEDRYMQRNVQFSAEGPRLANLAEERKFGVQFGRPGGAQRIADRFEREQPEDKSGDTNQANRPDAAEIEHILCTPGFTPNSPSTESVSYENAKTLSQALLAVRTDLKIADAQNSVRVELELPDFNLRVRPFDRLIAQTDFETLTLRVMQCSWSIQIEGTLEGEPFITREGGVKISAGLDREIPFTHTQRVNPAKANDPTNPTNPNNPNLVLFRNFIELDNLIPDLTQNRGNVHAKSSS